mmetsp:Transcript_78009/g.189002  ORF Transcript_78009/g.189002 Transcript_78009/m.189002 type:complete len:548 (-) Transcript_78009:177-1820(-)
MEAQAGAMKGPTEPWSPVERETIRAAVVRHGEHNWEAVVAAMEGFGRTREACSRFWQIAHPLIKGSWAPEEDELLVSLLEEIGDRVKVWSDIAGHVPGRNAKQCRERWVNNLDPTVNKGPWSAEEDAALIAAQKELGNKWSAIAERMPGRPDNAVKNRWYCMLNRTTAAPRTAPTRRASAAVAAATAAVKGRGASRRAAAASKAANATASRAASSPGASDAPARGGAGGRKRPQHRRSRSAPESLTFVLDAMQPDLQPRPGAAMAGGAVDAAESALEGAAAPEADAGAAEAPHEVAPVEKDSPTSFHKLFVGMDDSEADSAPMVGATVAANPVPLGRPRNSPSFSSMDGVLADLGSLHGGDQLWDAAPVTAKTHLAAQMRAHLAAQMAMHHSHSVQQPVQDEAGSGYWSGSNSEAGTAPQHGLDSPFGALQHGSEYTASDFGNMFGGDDDMDDDAQGSASRSGSFVTYDDDMLESAFALPLEPESPGRRPANAEPDDDMMSDGAFPDDTKFHEMDAEPFALGDAVQADDIVLHNAEDPFDYAEVCAL